jgi:nucleotide-binding universal stress UspA family protein
VCVFHADDWPSELPAELAFAEGPTAAASVVAAHEKRRAAAETLVADVSERLARAGFRTATATRDGSARSAILDYASTWQPDLIVLGSHGRTGVHRFLLGSVSEAVVRHAPCSVQVVRAR